ncbi:MAG: class I adenylate-forming enzyme family protein [Eggerthellaceae bacterium]|jgi:acyl-CoA synthetase (AMP-forming)/AMP-acid ligase II
MRVADIFDTACYRNPEKIAFYDDHSHVTYNDLWVRSHHVAAALQNDYGVRPGDHIGAFSQNRIELVELLYASNLIGAVLELYNALWSPKVVGNLVTEGNVKALFLETRKGCEAEKFEEVVECPIILLEDEEPASDCDRYQDIASVNRLDLCVHPGKSDDAAIEFFTSGTTSTPKSVIHTNEGVVMQGLVTAQAIDWERNDVLLLTFPFYHVAGFVAVLDSLVAQATTIVSHETHAQEVAKKISQYRVTRGGFIPIVIQRLLHEAIVNPKLDLTSLRIVSYGSSAVSPELLERCRRAFGCKFNQGYGMTESLGMVTLLNDSDHYDDELLGTVGKPLLGASVRVVRDDGTECDIGETGEIVIRSYGMMHGYGNRPELNEHVLSGGWLHSDDMGFIDAHGYLHVRGRRGGMIISGGENIYPQEVRDCIYAMSDNVLDVEVIGVPDPKWGQAMAAFLVVDDDSGIDSQALRNYCREQLGAYKRPKYVYFLNNMPLGGTGKVNLHALAEMHRQSLMDESA